MLKPVQTLTNGCPGVRWHILTKTRTFVLLRIDPSTQILPLLSSITVRQNERRAIYAITHVLYQASLPVTKHNEEWSPRTHKGRHRSSLPDKTYSESMCRCNNIAIHLGWYCSSHVTSLATDLSDKSLSALAALVREVLQEVSRQHSLLAAGQAEATWQILLALIQQNYRINRGRPHLLTS